MNANLKKFIGMAVLGMAVWVQSLPARAGSTYSREVSIVNDRANGTMAKTRYSADSTQYIGCNFSTTNGPVVLCSAVDKTGKALVCRSTNPQLVAVAKTITDFSHVEFSTLDDNPSSCAFLQVTNGSQHLR